MYLQVYIEKMLWDSIFWTAVFLTHYMNMIYLYQLGTKRFGSEMLNLNLIAYPIFATG